LDLVTLIAPGKIRQIEDAIEISIRGKKEAVRMALVCLLARGHLLIEDVPGVGKTTLGQSLARSVDGTFHRLQFTSDMLPSDVLGVTVFNSHTEQFEFKPGPVFTNFLLADEINRTTPKTQSALLEAMQERACTVRGHHYDLPSPFFVLATQNPIELEGTYPLPEAQLDRFLFNVLLDYLSPAEELKVIDLTTSTAVAQAEPVTNAAEILAFQQLVRMVPIAESVAKHAIELVRATRPRDASAPDFVKKYINYGGSVRAAQFLVLAAKARSLMKGRYHVSFEDIRALAVPVLRHRVLLNFHAESDRLTTDDLLNRLIESKPVPKD
jgi:MoxR-like ATPase